MIDHFCNNAFGQESDTGGADPYILHLMSAAFVGSTNIYLIHKIMQDCRCQFRQFCLLLLVISRQLLKAAVIDLARNIVLINPLEQSVKFLDPALCLCELSAFCSQLFFEFFFTLGTEFFTEQVLAIGYVPKKDLQEFQYTLFQYHCTDKVCSTHIFAFLPRGRTNKVILPLLKVLRGAVVQLFSAIGTVGNTGK